MANADVVALLENIALALELKQESPFRIRAYREAARNVAFLIPDIRQLFAEGKLEEIPGVGSSIAEKIADYLTTGKSAYLEAMGPEAPAGVLELTRIPGVGPRRARTIYDALNIQTAAALAEACRQGQIRALKGLGAATEARILQEIERLPERSRRIPLGVALPLAERIVASLRVWPGIDRAEPAGSVRRCMEMVGDIDVLVAAKDASVVRDAVTRGLPFAPELIASGPTKMTFLAPGAWQVDVRVVPERSWGAALQYFTGSMAHNIVLRERAMARRLKLNEYGLFDLDTGASVAGRTEAEIYERLDLDWIPPELREAAGEIEAAEAGRLPRLVESSDVRGDFHSHTMYSDGEAGIEAMARAALALGYEFLAITDHSPGLGITHGLDLAKLVRQRQEIVALRPKLAPFRILHGIELEIRASGELDFPDDILAGFDLVTASLHLATRQGTERITARLLAALAHPLVGILNHPSGRLLDTRPAYDFDLDQVIDAARAHGKALEINGSYLRLDLPDSAARRARDRGVVFSLGSDAHSIAGLGAMRLAVAVARRAWIGPDQVLNTWSADRRAASAAIRQPPVPGVSGGR